MQASAIPPANLPTINGAVHESGLLILDAHSVDNVKKSMITALRNKTLCRPPDNARWPLDSKGKCGIAADVLEGSFIHCGNGGGALNTSDLLIIEEDAGRIRGFVAMSVTPGSYGEIAVLCSANGTRGVGSRLMAAAEHLGYLLNCQTMQLHALTYVTGTREQCKANTAFSLVAYYERLGYHKVHEENGRDQDEVLMEKALNVRKKKRRAYH